MPIRSYKLVSLKLGFEIFPYSSRATAPYVQGVTLGDSFWGLLSIQSVLRTVSPGALAAQHLNLRNVRFHAAVIVFLCSYPLLGSQLSAGYSISVLRILNK